MPTKQRRRRQQGDGTIRQRDEAGLKWAIQYSLPSNGTRRRRVSKTVTGTYEYAKAYLEDLTYTVKRTTDKAARREPTKLKVAGLVEEWLTKYAYVKTRPNTAFDYGSKLRNHVLPVMGSLKLTSVTDDHIEEVFQGMGEKGKGLSLQTQRHVHWIMKALFQYAVEGHYIDQHPYSEKREPPENAKQLVVPMVPEEIEAMLKALEGHPNETFFLLAFQTGIRRSENVGLKWRNVDLKKPSISITKSVHRVTGKGMKEQKPKTDTSARTLGIGKQMAIRLHQLQIKQRESALRDGIRWSVDWPVFANSLGGWVTTDAMTRAFKRRMLAYEPLDMSRWHLHDLRHAHASILIDRDYNAKQIQERMGHSSIGITYDVYGHLLKGNDRGMAEIFEEYGKELKVITGANSVLTAI